MGMETRSANHNTMAAMPNFLARCENSAARSGSVASSACWANQRKHESHQICLKRWINGNVCELRPWKHVLKHLDWIYESLAADAGEPADDAADGQLPVVPVMTEGGGVHSADGVIQVVLLLTRAWQQVETDLLSCRFLRLRLSRHDCRSQECGLALLLKQEGGDDPAAALWFQFYIKKKKLKRVEFTKSLVDHCLCH